METVSLFRAISAWVANVYGPAVAVHSVEFHLERGDVRLPFPPPMPAPPEIEPTAVQAEILLALRSKDMRSDELAKACKVDKARIFERGRGLDQLTDAGLVAHRERAGFYLTERGEKVAEMIAAKREGK